MMTLTLPARPHRAAKATTIPRPIIRVALRPMREDTQDAKNITMAVTMR